ncbi:MAG: tetratricopeptide repeat protein [Alphaproteobacteria bacterium]|nr:tetratricopeptide repeat protein [Alphaproteobacteria bacterium]
MNFLKSKYILPAIILGLISGYGVAEWYVPRYLTPSSEIKPSTIDILAAIGAQPTYYRQTVSGNYLSSQFAQNNKDWDTADKYMQRVLQQEPENTELKKHVMVLAMASGHSDQSISLAKEIIQEEPDNILAVLFLTMDEFRRENYAEVLKLLDTAPNNTATAFLIPVLKMWAESSSGNFNTRNAPPSSFYAYHAMMIGNYLNKPKEALVYANKSFSNQDADIRDVEKIADLFYKLGNKDGAYKLYQALAEKGFDKDNLIPKIEQIDNEEPLDDLLKIQDVKTPKQGAALVFYDMANILLREQSDDSATIFAQMSLKLNPDLEENYIIIGNILSRYERYDEAIAAYKKINDTSEYYVSAQRQIADLYTAQEKNQEARDILARLYDKTKDVNALIQVGDIYRYEENYEDAIKVYSSVIGEWEETPEKYWHVLYARGMAYERLKEFKNSESDLIQALEFRPDHPYILNYLGYSWADQGINLDKSLDMISRALQSEPNDGYIADSLGWVYYKMGQYEEGIPFLERAVELMPYDATLNDHLGDAYWQVGRQVEAKFQWQRAINYSEDNETELKDKVEQKLVHGIPAQDIKKENKSILSKFLPKDNDV